MPNYRGISPEVSGVADLGSTSQKWNAVHANHVLTAGSLYRRRTRKAFTLADLAAAVADGDYAARDIDVGDYFTGASGYSYIFAGDNPMKGTYTGYPITVDHAGLIVDTHTTTQWNDTDDTTGGYVASSLHSYLTDTVLPIVKSDLGEAHLIAHRKLYTSRINATGYNRLGEASGCSNSTAWSTSQYIAALSEVQVYGSIVWSSSGYDTGEASQQLEVFRRFKYTDIFSGEPVSESVWLRDIASSTRTAIADAGGHAASIGASYARYAAGLICFH